MVKRYALLSKQGTAMSETVLTAREMRDPKLVQSAIDRAGDDWDGDPNFTDVSDNEAFHITMGDEQTQKLFDAVQNGEKVYAHCHWEDLTPEDVDEMHISCGIVEENGKDLQVPGFCTGDANVVSKTRQRDDGLFDMTLVGDATGFIASLEEGDTYWISPSQDSTGADPEGGIYTRAEIEKLVSAEMLAMLDGEDEPLVRVNLDCPLCKDSFAELNESGLPDFDSTTIIRHYTCNRGHKYDVTYEAVKKELVTPDKGE